MKKGMEETNTGNTTIMHKALKSVRNWCVNEIAGRPMQATIEAVLSIVNNALNAPPRNCDVGTPDEQLERYTKFCGRFEECSMCPLYGSVNYYRCEFAWAQMPYKEETNEHNSED